MVLTTSATRFLSTPPPPTNDTAATHLHYHPSSPLSTLKSLFHTAAAAVVTADAAAFAAIVDDDEEPDVTAELALAAETITTTNTNTARGLLLVASALYGTNFAAVKWMLQVAPDLSASTQTTLRFALAAACTMPWLFASSSSSTTPSLSSLSSSTTGETATSTTPTTTFHSPNTALLSPPSRSHQRRMSWPQPWSVHERGAVLAGLEVGLWNSIGYVAQAVGLEHTLASKSAFLCSLAVVTVPLLDWLWHGKTLKSPQLIGIVLALAGVACLELWGGGGDGSAATSAAVAASMANTPVLKTAADYASFLQPLAFGLGFWRMEQAMQIYPDQASRCTAAQLLAVFLASLLYMIVTSISFTATYTGVISLPDISLMMGQLQHWLSDPIIVLALIWTGCVTTATTVYMETVALKSLSAAETTLIFSTEPLWGSLTAALVLGETFGLPAVLGGTLILTACVLSNQNAPLPTSNDNTTVTNTTSNWFQQGSTTAKSWLSSVLPVRRDVLKRRRFNKRD